MTRLHFIQNVLPDGKIIRVSGPMGAKAIRFLRDQHLGEYDVIVSDAPTSPNQKDQTWLMLMQMAQVPALQQLLARPEIAVEALNYCPLPSKVVQLLQKGVQEPPPDADQQKMLAMQDALAKIDKTKADAGAANASAGLDQAKTILALADAGVKQQQARREAAINDFNAALTNFGAAGMPPRMPTTATDPGFAVLDDQQSGLPLPAQLPTGPIRRARQPSGMGDLFANLPPGTAGAPSAPPM
jgi:hypothetical protein